MALKPADKQVVTDNQPPLLLFLDDSGWSVSADHSCFAFTKTESSLIRGTALVCRSSVLRPYRYSPQPHLPLLSSPCLHPSTRLSCCHFPLRGHGLTLFTGSHTGVKYVWMQVCVLLFLSLNPFDHNPHQIKSVSTHTRHTRNGSQWVRLSLQISVSVPQRPSVMCVYRLWIMLSQLLIPVLCAPPHV